MPIVDVKVMEKVLTGAQKQAIAQGITDVFASVAGEAARPVTWVVINDVSTGQWTMGGEAVTSEGVREMLGHAPVAV